MHARPALPPVSLTPTPGVGGAFASDRKQPLSDTERSRLRRERLRAERQKSGAPSGAPAVTSGAPAQNLCAATISAASLYTVASGAPSGAPRVASGAPSQKPCAARVSEVFDFPGAPKSERYGSVTRTETAKSGQNAHLSIVTKTPALDLDCPIGLDVFCDWLTIYQDHFDPKDEDGNALVLPILNDGYVVRFEPEAIVSRGTVDADTGEYAFAPMFDASKAEYTVSRKMEHEGSFDTRVSVRCDGRRVELSGNVGRFGRADNLFGLRVLETVELASKIIAALGLPPFTGHDKCMAQARNQSFHKSHNAVITRVDLTANFSAGSRLAAYRVLHWMSGQGSARNSGKNPRNYGNGITWNEGSKRHYEKLYFKADELGKHVSDEVRAYCEENGILRYEVSLKARELADSGLQSLAGWAETSKEGIRMENVIYGKFAEVLTRNQVTVTEIQDIPGKLGLIARSYLNGENPYEAGHTAERTRRRWRSELMKYGVDIAQPIDVTRLTTRIRVIDLRPCAAPSWYQRTAA